MVIAERFSKLAAIADWTVPRRRRPPGIHGRVAGPRAAEAKMRRSFSKSFEQNEEGSYRPGWEWEEAGEKRRRKDCGAEGGL